MDRPRPCGCKGCRTCLICEAEYKIDIKSPLYNKQSNSYVYCPFCNKAWPGWDVDEFKTHPNHKGEAIKFPGIYIDLNFLSDTEEKLLINDLDEIPWDLSQSGRRKQNFGPKCNFKKRKLRLGNFIGFPSSTKFVQDKFNSVPILKGFKTIEQCSLEYNPERGASIDPHVDDCWVWGERIITVNLLADSVLTMTYNSKPRKYNLDCVKTYPSVLTDDGELNTVSHSYTVTPKYQEDKGPIVRIPMPRKSLLVMYGAARYDWEHQVLREDILQRRVCLAYREFTPPYLERGDKYEEGRDILLQAQNFF
ncbi:alpha-ketoglutarate-dependent dioxygenase alkB homolog 4 [Anoplophora glabripennis]|uniref:alpha-ketoglutarate-dependent dioxygenase alkB homolog 4 n=1 Tax=Anoplophora glabripennis TaxID=217634 RepID=UPI0008735FF5|nr:alpha-ketoglutarate-dependent dioxygenase alkB homolog 4 [Anoplophora glabripennis]